MRPALRDPALVEGTRLVMPSQTELMNGRLALHPVLPQTAVLIPARHLNLVLPEYVSVLMEAPNIVMLIMKLGDTNGQLVLPLRLEELELVEETELAPGQAEQKAAELAAVSSKTTSSRKSFRTSLI